MTTFRGPKPEDVTVKTDVDFLRVIELDKLWLDPSGFIRLMPAKTFLSETLSNLQHWATINSRYLIVTKELVDWLKAYIKGRSAIEICSGQGDLGHYLGIRMSDNYSQQNADVQAHYAQFGHRTTFPPPSVYNLDAVKAAKKYKPEIVIGAFVTHGYKGIVLPTSDPKYARQHGSGNIYGPQEEDILLHCKTYVMIGNEHTHRDKPLLKVPHETLKFPWLVTRAEKQDQNAIFIWHR